MKTPSLGPSTNSSPLSVFNHSLLKFKSSILFRRGGSPLYWLDDMDKNVGMMEAMFSWLSYWKSPALLHDKFEELELFLLLLFSSFCLSPSLLLSLLPLGGGSDYRKWADNEHQLLLFQANFCLCISNKLPICLSIKFISISLVNKWSCSSRWLYQTLFLLLIWKRFYSYKHSTF